MSSFMVCSFSHVDIEHGTCPGERTAALGFARLTAELQRKALNVDATLLQLLIDNDGPADLSWRTARRNRHGVIAIEDRVDELFAGVVEDLLLKAAARGRDRGVAALFGDSVLA